MCLLREEGDINIYDIVKSVMFFFSFFMNITNNQIKVPHQCVYKTDRFEIISIKTYFQCDLMHMHLRDN